ncbi:hypothetical protein A6V39_03525 [Candidatus Mycoplasma haematobovis]|uniref:Uncharacterized protein n=1 Tax=Candidatus Mycoplasma haematobovis TaxID=432608 RepID=A0A1A9QDC0_9MOLU|nr:hypothetical protein [Candidatus Mycoplasma haematobovis]OAL09956.1 hypothetical protein A6V39_03525 [Candidatus Mycoplasma haematobovis]
MKTGTTILSIGAGLGTLGGAGALTSHFLLSSRVIDVLKQKGHDFLNFENDTDLTTWKTIAKAYSAGKNKLGTLVINAPASSQEVPEADARKLRNACKDIINSKNYTDDTLKATEQWCVKPITVQALANKNRKVLELEESKDNDTVQWDAKTIDYVKPNAENKIPNATLKAVTIDKVEDRKKIKADCRTLRDKYTHDKDFHENYKQFETWCTVNK